MPDADTAPLTAARPAPAEAPQPLLVRVLLEPALSARLAPREWHRVLWQARSEGLIGRLAHRVQEAGVFEQAPAKARSHMLAGGIAALSSQTAVRFEVNRVLRALRGVELPLLLMKGSAYVHTGLRAGLGRFVGDVDVMVPRDRIDELERRLVAQGWVAAELDDYDQHYYRAWTHEIPPLQHPERDTPLDIHHNIAALTSRVRADAAAILAAAVPLADPRLRVMGPADMVLHSCVHLFNDEVGMPLRDLFDLHDLLCEFSPRPGFWDELLARARLHGVQRPCWHMLDQLRRQLATPIPAAVLAASAGWAPPVPLRALMRALFALRFRPADPDGDGPAKAIAGFLLYLRSHWLRMPAPMLARHLLVKGWRRLRPARDDAQDPLPPLPR